MRKSQLELVLSNLNICEFTLILDESLVRQVTSVLDDLLVFMRCLVTLAIVLFSHSAVVTKQLRCAVSK